MSESIPRKYQVFISSTFTDLKAHRARALIGVVRAGHIPFCFEYRYPEGTNLLPAIRKAIAGSQFFVLILGHRLGSGPNQKTSYVERELRYAKKYGLTVLPYIMDEATVNRKRSRLDRKRTDDRMEIGKEERYWKFRNSLMQSTKTAWAIFRDPGDLERDLLAHFSASHDVPGYILETKDTASIIRVAASNEVVKELVERVGRFTIVERRLSDAPEKKRAMAESFRQVWGDYITSGKYEKIFLESGSSIAYVAKQISELLPKHAPGETAQRRPVVSTNNALVYLDLWLCDNVLCHPEPESPPAEDEKYGAMYGALTARHRKPDYHLPRLERDDPESWRLVLNLSGKLAAGIKRPARSLILAAASGLKVSRRVELVQRSEPTQFNSAIAPCSDPMTRSLLEQCYGFHVGSYQNRLFKRALYLSGIPTIVFMHDSKVDCRVEIDKCHFLCDKGLSWQRLISTYPLGLWIGCDRNSHDTVRAKLRARLNPGEWRFKTYDDVGKYPVLVAWNSAFRRACSQCGIVLPWQES